MLFKTQYRPAEYNKQVTVGQNLQNLKEYVKRVFFFSEEYFILSPVKISYGQPSFVSPARGDMNFFFFFLTRIVIFERPWELLVENNA